MGDLIHTLPAVTDAKKNLPNVQFDWVAEESFAEIPIWHPGVDRVISIAFRRWRKNVLQAIQSGELCNAFKQVRSSKYDYVIDAQGLLKSAFVTGFARGNRCGMDFQTSRESLASLAYQSKFHVPVNMHAIERVRLLFAKVLDYSYNKQNLDYGLHRTIFTIESLTTPYLVFLHGTSRETKLWPESQWIELAKIAQTKGYAVYMTWGNEQEKQRADKISVHSEGCTVLPKMSLAKVAALLSQASGVIGVDTGLSHLAAALDIPAVTIYMDTCPDLTGTCGINQICLSQEQNIANTTPTAGLQILKTQTITAQLVWENLQESLK